METKRERLKNSIWFVTTYCTSVMVASYSDADNYEGFCVFPCI